MKDKAGTAYVSKDRVHTIIININVKENSTKAGLIGTLAEEASHIVNGVAGRQIETGTEEKGLVRVQEGLQMLTLRRNIRIVSKV